MYADQHDKVVLTDGRVLLAGGVSAGGGLAADAEIYDPVSGESQSAAGFLGTPRQGHQALLLADGRVELTGGTSRDGHAVGSMEIFDPITELFGSALRGAAEKVGPNGFAVAESIPSDGTSDVATNAHVTIRFTEPLTHSAATTASIRLNGSSGAVPIDIVLAEQGRLLIVRPATELTSGQEFTLTLDGLTGSNNSASFSTVIRFRTGPLGSEKRQPAADPESDAANAHWRTLPPLTAPAGVTALAGQVLRLNGAPLADVTVKIDTVSARTDRTGRFLVSPLPAGRHEMIIDGRTASVGEVVYGVFEVGVDVIARRTNVLPYTSWMPRIDTAHAVTITSPTTQEVVVTTPLIPGLELRLAPGTILRDIDGKIAQQVSITPIPLERPPFPLPRDVYVPISFTVQPGGGYVYAGGGKGAMLYYPNYRQAKAGQHFDVWHYDPEVRGWYVYGQGHVDATAVRSWRPSVRANH